MKRKASPKLPHSSARQKKPKYTTQQIAALQQRALKLWRADSAALKRSHDTAAQLGRVLIEVRAALRWTHGSFKEWWQTHGLTQSRVSYCMDLAKGSLGQRRARLPDEDTVIRRQVSIVVKEELASFLKYVTHETQPPVLEEIEEKLVFFVGGTLMELSKLPGWRVNSPAKPEVKAKMKEFRAALTALIDALYPGSECETNGQLMEKLPPPETVAPAPPAPDTAAAVAAGAGFGS